MPYFRVQVSAHGIELPFADGSDPAIGFYTTRDVRAHDATEAHQLVKKKVMADWLPGGQYAFGNRLGDLQLAIEDTSQLGIIQGIFGRKRKGYTFYAHED